MPTLPINGAQLRVRMVELELDRLKLDPDNPRLHTAYLTHALPSRPSEKQIIQALEGLPEFQALLDWKAGALSRLRPHSVVGEMYILIAIKFYCRLLSTGHC
jgi:hypothetical protein